MARRLAMGSSSLTHFDLLDEYARTRQLNEVE